MSSIQKNSLLNILAAAQNSAKPLNEDDKKALKELERLCAEGADEMRLVDCAAYEAANMWGISDVWISAMSGMYQTDFQTLAPNEAEQVVGQAFEAIDWDEVENAAWKAGSDVINNAVNNIMAEKIEKMNI